MLNSPAVNACEFENVLTTPRAVELKESHPHLTQIELFLQSIYKLQTKFLFTPHFTALVDEGAPDRSIPYWAAGCSR